MALSLTGGKDKKKSSEQAAFNQTENNVMSARASGLLAGGISDLKARAYTPVDLARVQQFQDPYSSQVRDVTMAQLGQDRSVAYNQLDDRLAKSGAFGDTRRGIQEAEVAGQFDRTSAATLAGLNSAGFSQALQAAMGENQGRNEFDLGTQDLIARLLSMYGQEGTRTTSGTSSGSSKGTGTSLGFSFSPFGPQGGK
jgi:hypothetical protein